MAVAGVGGNNNTSNAKEVEVVDKSKVGFNGLTSETFLKLLIAQLQNQDPTAPVGNNELLQQISAMRSLQSNIELSDTLKAFGNNQQVSSGASFLGKIVTGTNSENKEVTGIADRVYLADGKLMVGMGTDSVEISKVTGVGLLSL
jgi:flagellar basal-body rod modification protein FlgD